MREINQTILITGAAGFIGSFLAKRVLEQNQDVKVVGYDNMNTYYDVRGYECCQDLSILLL